MKPKIKIVAAVILSSSRCLAAGEPPAQLAAQSDSVTETPSAGGNEAERIADKRYKEMLDKMQAAVEEIAQLYGNPVFLQVFTNDAERASELKQRLRASQAGDTIRREVADLEKKRDDLLSDIALRERESARISSKLVRQRFALDALAKAVEQARTAVEETAK